MGDSTCDKPFRGPGFATLFYSETLGEMFTYGDLLMGMDIDVWPESEADYETLLWTYDAVPVGETGPARVR